MTESIGTLPFWQLTFDAEGDSDPAAIKTFIDEIGSEGVTDLFVFSHGWNNSQPTARKLYKAWFGTLADQLADANTTRPVKVGLVGVFWPSQRWSDEPIPDFQPDQGGASATGGGAAATVVNERVKAGPPTIDDETL